MYFSVHIQTVSQQLSEHPQTQEESIRSIQETPNSQFRLVLSVTPCVPRISSLESVNDNTSPLLFSSTSSLTFVPTPDSPKDQPPPSPTSSTSSLTSFHSCNTSSQHNTLSPELFSPTPTSQNKWPSPPPLPQRSPRIRRRHNLHNYASLASTNRSQEKRNSVGAPPLDYLTLTRLYVITAIILIEWYEISNLASDRFTDLQKFSHFFPT